METTFKIRNGAWELAASYHRPVSMDGNRIVEPLPLVVICHGFTGSRIGVDRLFVKAAREWSEAGFAVLRFDYAGCGESEGDYGAGGLEAMVEQTRLVLDYALSMPGIKTDQVTLLGHSLGGAVAVLSASSDERVGRLVLWSPVANPLGDIVRIVGRDVYNQALTAGKADYLGYGLTANFFHSLASHHPFQEARKFKGSIFIAHGTGDDVIPVDYSFLYQKIFRIRRGGSCDKEIIRDAGHTFSSADSVQHVIRKTREWLTGEACAESHIV